MVVHRLLVKAEPHKMELNLPGQKSKALRRALQLSMVTERGGKTRSPDLSFGKGKKAINSLCFYICWSRQEEGKLNVDKGQRMKNYRAALQIFFFFF